VTRVAAFVPDLMDRSRFAAYTVMFLRSLDEVLPPGCEVLVVDLDRAGPLEGRLPEGVRVVGFASHVHGEVLAAALAAGVSDALPRSQLFRRLDEILA
jgi:hypothetical protein